MRQFSRIDLLKMGHLSSFMVFLDVYLLHQPMKLIGIWVNHLCDWFVERLISNPNYSIYAKEFDFAVVFIRNSQFVATDRCKKSSFDYVFELNRWMFSPFVLCIWSSNVDVYILCILIIFEFIQACKQNAYDWERENNDISIRQSILKKYFFFFIFENCTRCSNL